MLMIIKSLLQQTHYADIMLTFVVQTRRKIDGTDHKIFFQTVVIAKQVVRHRFISFFGNICQLLKRYITRYELYARKIRIDVNEVI